MEEKVYTTFIIVTKYSWENRIINAMCCLQHCYHCSVGNNIKIKSILSRYYDLTPTPLKIELKFEIIIILRKLRYIITSIYL